MLKPFRDKCKLHSYHSLESRCHRNRSQRLIFRLSMTTVKLNLQDGCRFRNVWFRCASKVNLERKIFPRAIFSAMAHEEEVPTIRPPESVVITVLRCKNLVGQITHLFLILLYGELWRLFGSPTRETESFFTS